MENTEKMDPKVVQIESLLGRYLKRFAADGSVNSVGGHHLDEDSLSAFAEGNLGERESAPMISHLVDCSYCRNVTAELVRLDMAFAEEVPVRAAAEEQAPRRVSDVLSTILSRIFGGADGAVFAHNESDDDPKPETRDQEEKE
jgi:hypothetical protein